MTVGEFCRRLTKRQSSDSLAPSTIEGHAVNERRGMTSSSSGQESEPVYDWCWFARNMQDVMHTNERLSAEVLDIVAGADALAHRIVARPTSAYSDRPQDYVASLLVSRSFRLAVSSIYLALSGYADSAVNLDRTVWEIGIRLLDMTRAPDAAALGYLLDSAQSEVDHLKVELQYREGEGLETAHLADHLANAESEVRDLTEAAHARDLDATKIKNKHGRLNFRQVCKDFGIEKAYLVNYAFASGHVHEKNMASSDYVTEANLERGFELGPLTDARLARFSVMDALTNFCQVLSLASDIVEDPEAIEAAESLFAQLPGAG